MEHNERLERLLQLCNQTRLAIQETEATTFVNLEELGWLGRLREAASSPRAEPALTKCKGCERVFLSSRLHVHQCRKAPPPPPGFYSGSSRGSQHHHQPAPPPQKKKKKASQPAASSRPIINLGEVKHYVPEVDLVTDYLGGLVDRLCFPSHLKGRRRARARAEGREREVGRDKDQLVSSDGINNHNEEASVENLNVNSSKKRKHAG